MADGGEDDVSGVAMAAFEMAAAEVDIGPSTNGCCPYWPPVS